MIEILKAMRVTRVAAVLAIAIIATNALTNIDLVRLNLKFLEGIEEHEIDDALTGLALIFVALPIDLWQRRKRQRAAIEAQKRRTLKATMRTVQGIVNNFLNNLFLFEMEAAAVMPSGSLDLLEALIVTNKFAFLSVKSTAAGTIVATAAQNGVTSTASSSPNISSVAVMLCMIAINSGATTTVELDVDLFACKVAGLVRY
jgi:hypothetical protein